MWIITLSSKANLNHLTGMVILLYMSKVFALHCVSTITITLCIHGYCTLSVHGYHTVLKEEEKQTKTSTHKIPHPMTHYADQEEPTMCELHPRCGPPVRLCRWHEYAHAHAHAHASTLAGTSLLTRQCKHDYVCAMQQPCLLPVSN